MSGGELLENGGWRSAAASLLDLSEYPGALKSKVDQLYEHLAVFAGVDSADGLSDHPEASDSQLAAGVALGSIDAGRCLADGVRTRAFASGLAAAVDEARRRFPGRPTRLLYAGCGPFATLFLPLATRFSPEELQVTLVDIHERVLESAVAVLSHLGLSDFVEEAVVADLCQPHFAPGRFEVAVTETMQRALDKEAQVAVSVQLDKILPEGGILVPRRITLSVELAALGTEFGLDGQQRQRLPVGDVFEVSRATLPEIARCLAEGATDPVEFQIPEGGDLAPYTGALLCTRIETFGGIGLGDYESGLTGTKTLAEVALRAGARYRASYRFGERPGLEITSV